VAGRDGGLDDAAVVQSNAREAICDAMPTITELSAALPRLDSTHCYRPERRLVVMLAIVMMESTSAVRLAASRSCQTWIFCS
jgi:hypothetical protein